MEKLTSKCLTVILVSIFLTGSTFFNSSRTWAAISISDSAGDAEGGTSFSDFLGLEVSETSASLLFRIDFANLSQGTNGALLLDVDGNRQTRAGLHLTEAKIEFTIAILGISSAQFFDMRPDGNSVNLTCSVQGNSFYIDLPKSALSGDRTEDMEIAGIASLDFLCDGMDRMPDQGFVRFSTGELHIDNRGLQLAPFSFLTDPAGDTSTPVDLKGMQVEVDGEHLVIRNHYHHSIDPRDIDEVSIGTIYIDTDGDILTGFQNAIGVFPTFGADVVLYYEIYPLALGGELYAVLIIEDPEEPAEQAMVSIGVHSSDSSFTGNDEWIEFTLPLAFLPVVSNNAIILADSMAPLASLFDSFPDSGGFRLRDGSIKPFNSCQTEEIHIADARGDSFAFGGDNDDLIEMRACHCEEGTLLVVEYSDLDLLGRAVTSIFIDVDQNSSTGEVFQGAGDNLIGVEKTLVYGLSDTSGRMPVSRAEGGNAGTYFGGGAGSVAFFTAIMVEGATGDLIRGINPLFTVNLYSEKAYITIPYRLLGDDGKMDMYTWTLSGTFGVGTFADGIPDSGVFSINDAPDMAVDDDADDKADSGCFIATSARRNVVD